ncbi:MAG: hypothetical protein HQ592_15640, partial [Planctomycetes bacterium]|nr:hypothetical protein [Planctomycetota bacterium]
MLAVQLIAIILLGTGGFLAAAGLLLLGARIARIERRTFAKALEATLIGTVALFAISFILGSVPVVGG